MQRAPLWVPCGGACTFLASYGNPLDENVEVEPAARCPALWGELNILGILKMAFDREPHREPGNPPAARENQGVRRPTQGLLVTGQEGWPVGLSTADSGVSHLICILAFGLHRKP